MTLGSTRAVDLRISITGVHRDTLHMSESSVSILKYEVKMCYKYTVTLKILDFELNTRM